MPNMTTAAWVAMTTGNFSDREDVLYRLNNVLNAVCKSSD